MTRASTQRTTAGGKTVTLDTTATKPRRIQPTAASVQDPAQLARHLLELQQATSDATAGTRSLPMLGGNWIRGVAFSAGVPLAIAHGLGRPSQGWIPTDVTAASTFFRSAPVDPRTLTLTASASCIADLYVW